MFKIVVTVIALAGGLPMGDTTKYTSVDRFEYSSDCEAAREKSTPGLLDQLNADLRERGAPKNVYFTVRTADCVFYEADPASDALSQVLRDMLRGGGFGTMQP